MKWAKAVARICGLENLLCFVPGACAPGFMLPPAPQAKTAVFVEGDFLRRLGLAVVAATTPGEVELGFYFR